MSRVFTWRIKSLIRRWGRSFFAWFGYKESSFKRSGYITQNIAALKSDLALSGRTLRVGFIVCDQAKWSAGPLFDALRQDPRFDCGFIPTLSDISLRLPKAARQDDFRKNKKFFADQGDIWGNLYIPDQDRMRDVPSITCDVIFIQQPWGMRDFPRQLAPHTLVAYVPYGFSIIENDWMEFRLEGFHEYLWKYFAQTSANAAVNKTSTIPGLPLPEAVLVTGYPKLDIYLSPNPQRSSITAWPRASESTRKRVIFAPHHAIGKNTLNISTFLWSAQAMLNLAKAHPEIDFLLKPHPNLSFQMLRTKHLPAHTYSQWICDWKQLKNTAVFDGGNYFDLFRTSDIMITDSVSFLAEYLPTGQPIIRLLHPENTQLRAAFQNLCKGLYSVQTTSALNEVFSEIMVEQIDPLATVRQNLIRQVMPFDEPASQIVLQVLAELLADQKPISG